MNYLAIFFIFLGSTAFADIVAEKRLTGSLLPGGNHTVQVTSQGDIQYFISGNEAEVVVLAKLSAEMLQQFNFAVEKVSKTLRPFTETERADLFVTCTGGTSLLKVYPNVDHPLPIMAIGCGKKVTLSESVRYSGIIEKTLFAFDYYFTPFLRD